VSGGRSAARRRSTETPDRLSRLRDPALPFLRGGRREGLELQQHSGQDLPDLVVEAAGDPPPLRLLGRERTAARLVPFRLQPFEHLIETLDELHHFRPAGLGQPLAGPEQVYRAHPLDKAVDG